MNVKQGLKKKNQLVTELKRLYEIVKIHNSIEVGNTRRYSVKETLDEIDSLTSELVELKTRIHIANASVYSEIFLMAELKGKVKQLKAISVEEGKNSAGRFSAVIEVKEVELNVVQRDQMVKEIEAKIEALQEALDTHNAITLV